MRLEIFAFIYLIFIIYVIIKAGNKNRTEQNSDKKNNINMSSRPQMTNTRAYTGRHDRSMSGTGYKPSQALSRSGRSMTSRGRQTATVTRYEPKSGKAVANVEGVGKLFSKKNSGFDDYPARNISKKEFGKIHIKNADSMTYSHIYEGHEPWDDCLPKEKDPWEKGFFDRFREE